MAAITERGRLQAERILAAAHEVFVAGGLGGFSMRSVAARLGTSLSTVQHYYPTRESLVEAMLLESAALYQRAIDARLAQMPQASQLDRFMAAMDLLLAETRKPEVADALVQMWAAARVDALAASTVARIQRRQRKTVRALLGGAAPALSESTLDARAALAVALIEGLVLQHAGLRGASAAGNGALNDAARAALRALATQRP